MTKCCQFVEFKCVWHQLAEYLSWNLNCCAQSLGFKVSVAQEEELLTQYCLSLHWGSKVAMLLGLVENLNLRWSLELNLSWIAAYIIMKHWIEFGIPEWHMKVRISCDMVKYCSDKFWCKYLSMHEKSPHVRFRGASHRNCSHRNIEVISSNIRQVLSMSYQ